MAIAIVIQKCAAGPPAIFFIVHAGVLGYVGKSAVAVIVKQNVVAPETAEEIVPAVIVVIADAHAGLPAGTRESRFVGDVGEAAIGIISVEMRSWRFSLVPFGVE